MTVEEVVSYIEDWIENRKTGYIQINFYEGGVANINLHTCVKTTKKESANATGKNQN